MSKETDPHADFTLDLDASILEAAVASVDKHMAKPPAESAEVPEATMDVDLEVDLDIEVELEEDAPSEPGDDERVARLEAALVDSEAQLQALEDQLAALQVERDEALAARDKYREDATQYKLRGMKISVARKRLMEAHEALKKRHEDLRTRSEEVEGLAHNLRQRLVDQESDRERLKRRHARELDEARAFSHDKMAKALMPALDNLDLAIQHIDSTPPEQMVDGVRMIFTQLSKSLERVGLTRVDQTDVPFDPAVHEALRHAPDERPAGHIITVHQTGYRLHDRLLRAARVSVSAGPTEAPVPAELEVEPPTAASAVEE